MTTCDPATLTAALSAGPSRAVALRCGDERVTFAELDERAGRVAAALRADGIPPGARVAYLGGTSPRFFEVLVGCAMAGTVLVPLNWRLAAAELAAILDDACAEVLIVDARYEHVAPALVRSRQPTRLVTVSGAGDSARYNAWARPRVPAAARALGSPDGAVLQVYTSGTTGRPKGVMVSEAALMPYLDELANAARIERGGVSLGTLPLFHIGGIGWSLAGLVRGATTVLLPELDPDAALEAIERDRVTTMIAVPTVIRMLLDSPRLTGSDVRSLHTLYYGGGPMTQPLLERALAHFGCELVQGFGLTECPLVTVLTPADHRSPENLRSCGRPLPKTELRLVGPDGTDVPAGEVGEIWVRSPFTMLGYWRQPEATAQAVTPDGWLRTGDAGRVGPDGLLHLADRIKDMIISGGENVYPAEVENVLAAHPDVVESAVIGVPSERWTETVKAVVVRRERSQTSGEDLISFCRERLAHYKCPTSVEFVAALPKTASGKVTKYQLREKVG